MYADVSTDQFSLMEGSVIHLPTGAEFTPVSRSAESINVWTGNIERVTADGRIFKYDEVLRAMRSYWLSHLIEAFAKVA